MWELICLQVWGRQDEEEIARLHPKRGVCFINIVNGISKGVEWDPIMRKILPLVHENSTCYFSHHI